MRLSRFCKNFLQQTQKTLLEQCDFHKPFQQKILIACSGGSDSLALLHALSFLFGKNNLGVIYVNHQTRPETKDEGIWLQQTFQNLAKEWFIKEIQENSLLKPSENFLRNARYSILNSIAKNNAYNFIALGHTQDDQIETILFRYIRGTGMNGLRGIPYRRDSIIRPLLNISKKMCQNFLFELGVSTWIEDPSNAENDYARNRIRNELMPICEKIHNGFSRGIIDTKSILEEEHAFLDSIADNWIEKNRRNYGCERSDYPSLPIAIQRRVLINLFRLFNRDDTLSFSMVEKIRFSLLKKDHRKTRKSFSLSGSRILCIDRQSIRFIDKNPLVDSEKNWEITISSLGFYEYPYGKLEIKVYHKNTFIMPTMNKKDLVAYFDASFVKFPLTFRSRKHGDAIQIFGKSFIQKKVKNVFIDEGILYEQRIKTPLVVSDENILWIAGVIRSHHALVTQDTDEILEIRMLPCDEKRNYKFL